MQGKPSPPSEIFTYKNSSKCRVKFISISTNVKAQLFYVQAKPYDDYL
jgi:hypothetical protein